MREKLTGLRVTFRLTEEQTQLIRSAMKLHETSNVSEFVRQSAVLAAKRRIEEAALEKARRMAARKYVELATGETAGVNEDAGGQPSHSAEVHPSAVAADHDLAVAAEAAAASIRRGGGSAKPGPSESRPRPKM